MTVYVTCEYHTTLHKELENPWILICGGVLEVVFLHIGVAMFKHVRDRLLLTSFSKC